MYKILSIYQMFNAFDLDKLNFVVLTGMCVGPFDLKTVFKANPKTTKPVNVIALEQVFETSSKNS